MGSSDYKNSVAVFGGGFDPPGNHHLSIARRLTEIFPRVIVIPSGPRPDRGYRFDDPQLRQQLATAAFGGLPGVELDLSDLSKERFTFTYDLDQRLRASSNPVHVIGTDLVRGGAQHSPIVSSWYRGREVWNELNFLVLTRPGFALDPAELPPHATLLELDLPGSSTEIREKLARGESVAHLVPKAVSELLASNAPSPDERDANKP